MKVSAIVYESVDGTLQPRGRGACNMYSPPSGDHPLTQYVSLNFGQYHIHLNKDDFTKFCNHFLKFSMYNSRKRLK